MAKNITARCQFQGRFPDSKPKVSFTTNVDQLTAALMVKNHVAAFRQVMAEQWPDKSIRPRLRKLVITVNFPADFQ
jgi:hypothetical protein